ncbi:MAG: ParB N-terminal domain-containing protein [Kiritimatiellaeota bacterium]|nr:ParB N-terminal domain-containing protein [Kiritimatiellota bacterium]
MQFFPSDIKMAAENNLLYGRFTLANADDAALVESMRNHGILTPLQVSADTYLLSGHRRLAAAKHLGLNAVPVTIADDVVFMDLSPDERLKELRQRNQQREKTFDERVAEVAADTDPDTAYDDLIQYRAARQRIARDTNMEMGARKPRAEITTKAFLEAVLKIVEEHRDVWLQKQIRIPGQTFPPHHAGAVGGPHPDGGHLRRDPPGHDVGGLPAARGLCRQAAGEIS